MNKQEIIKHYKALIQCEQFVVTGSFVLRMLGLCKSNGDIDIIVVNPTPDSVEMMKRLQEEFPAKTKASGEKCIIFMHEETKMDIFIVKKRIESIKLELGYEISTISHIIEAKKTMGRPKDILQLIGMSNRIISQDEIKPYGLASL